VRRYIFPLILGLGGCAILISLGVWQIKRLAWKEALLAAIDAKIHDAPVPIAGLGAPDPAGARYLPVTATGRTTGPEILVLSGRKDQGAGYEVISAFETAEGRKLLVDRGFVAEEARSSPRPPVALTITGNLDWPNETDSYTPPPDPTTHIWFARDVPAMAKALGTDPLMVVIRKADGESPSIVPVPVDTAGIPNDHFEYALTWFSLAFVWAGMTAYLVWRIRQRTV